MSRIFLLIAVFFLLCIIGYTSISFYQSQQYGRISNEDQVQQENDELITYRTNFIEGIKNNGISLKNIELKDSSGNLLPYSDFAKKSQKPVVVYRFSELHCTSCVTSALKLFRQWEDSIGKDNILILGNYRNNRVFNRIKKEYGIQNVQVYNTPMLNNVAEDLGYPYFLVVNEHSIITSIFVPNKAAPKVTNNYFDMVGKRYFKKKNNKSKKLAFTR